MKIFDNRATINFNITNNSRSFLVFTNNTTGNYVGLVGCDSGGILYFKDILIQSGIAISRNTNTLTIENSSGRAICGCFIIFEGNIEYKS